MGHPSSFRISRVPNYLFVCLVLHTSCVYGTITHFGLTFQLVLLQSMINHTRLIPLRSPLLRESQLISFPKGTEMFHFPSFASITYVFSYWYPPYSGWVPPFRNLRIKGYLPPPRSFSQAITSFIASDCQGIHHMHLITWLYNPKQSPTLTSKVRTDCYACFSTHIALIQFVASWT